MPRYTNAREFLQAVMNRYRSISGYSDDGVSYSCSKGHRSVCTFRTDYRQPGLFRFSFTRPHPFKPLSYIVTSYAIGSDGKQAYFYSRSFEGKEELEQEKSLEMAVAGATGISSGTAHTIGELLFDEIGGFSFLDLKRIRFRRTREIDGVHCIAISGLHPNGGRITAWFGVDDLLLRRKLRKHSRGKTDELRFHVNSNTNYSLDFFSIPKIDN
jgi:hypothetical protein